MSTRWNVGVIGGGYACFMAANRLTRRADVDVTLINPRAQFVERIRLHQLLSQTHTPTHDLAGLLAERVHLLVDSVTRIEVAGRRLSLSGGGDLTYDYLVYAVGSTSAATLVPGAAEHAQQVGSLEEAQRLHAALAALPASAPVAVVGGGPTGIETAAELAETGRAVTLVGGGDLGPSLHPRARHGLARRLHRLGVQVLQGTGARAAEVTADEARPAAGRSIPSTRTGPAAGAAGARRRGRRPAPARRTGRPGPG